MKDILVPISPGELLDKITILRIKAARIDDADKLRNVRLELDLLHSKSRTWLRSSQTGAFSLTYWTPRRFMTTSQSATTKKQISQEHSSILLQERALCKALLSISKAKLV